MASGFAQRLFLPLTPIVNTAIFSTGFVTTLASELSHQRAGNFTKASERLFVVSLHGSRNGTWMTAVQKTDRVTEKTMLALGLDDTRVLIRELVRKSEYQTGSRMVAYERVGQMIGTSGMWVRKLVNGYGDIRLLHTTAMNIQQAYSRLCIQTERSAQKIEERNASIASALASLSGKAE